MTAGHKMAKALPKNIFDAKLQGFWREGKRFLRHAIAVKPSLEPSRHSYGGPLPHKGGKCPNCRRRLGLLWSLDLTDPLFPDFVREGFGPSAQLPLAICWQCLAATYRVTSETQIRCFPFDDNVEALEEDETPFEELPDEAPPGWLLLERLPSSIDAILSLANQVGWDEIDEPAQRAVNKHLGLKKASSWDLPQSQVGGTLLPYQGNSDTVCPNPSCPAAKLEHPYGEFERPYLMKELALVHWKTDPVLRPICFQLVYSVCCVCFSIRGEYRCT